LLECWGGTKVIFVGSVVMGFGISKRAVISLLRMGCKRWCELWGIIECQFISIAGSSKTDKDSITQFTITIIMTIMFNQYT
jgi:hypothetical protein